MTDWWIDKINKNPGIIIIILYYYIKVGSNDLSLRRPDGN